jgi:hypothetical protein
MTDPVKYFYRTTMKKNRKRRFMKTTRFYKNAVLLLSLGLSFGSCLNDKDDEFDVMADVVTLKKMIDDEVKYAPAYYAYGNQSITSGTVTLPDGETVQLESLSASTYTFLIEPDDEDFTTTPPAEGNYLFEVTSTNGEVLESSDNQEFDDLGFAVVDSVGFDENETYLYLTWDEVTGADYYVVRLLDSSENIIFNGYSVEGDETEYYISSYYTTTGTWTVTPTDGATYILRIQTAKYDSDATEDNNIYNIQEFSVSDTEITWRSGSN